MTDSPYVLTRTDGVDTLHRYPRAECDAEGRETIDAETADALLALGDTRRCNHCYSEDPS